jgi:hypothetical protein
MTLSEFLEALYGEKEDHQHLLIWKQRDNISFWTPDIDKAVKHIKSKGKVDIYFQVGLAGQAHGKKQRCTKDEEDGRPVVALPGLFADIDILDPQAHKTGNLPGSVDEATSLVSGEGFDPTMIVHSGHGLQVYWLFKELLDTDTPEKRKAAADLLEKLKAHLKDKASKKGWSVDAVQDLVRIFRPPGTWNCKTAEKVQVKVIHYEPYRRYNPEDLEELLPELPAGHLNRGEAGGSNDVSSDDIKSIEKEIFIDPTATVQMHKFMALCQAEPRFKASWEENRPDLNDQTASGYDQSCANFAAQAGLTNQEIADLLIHRRRERGHKIDSNNAQKYARTIAKARKKAEDKTDISNVIADLKLSGDPSCVYDHIDAFAALDTVRFAKVKTELKNIFKNKLNLNDFNAAVTAAKRAFNEKTLLAQNSELPTIILTDRQHRDVQKEAVAALLKKNDPPEIFIRDKTLVRILHDENKRPYIDKYSESSILSKLSECANFYIQGLKGSEITFL